MATKQKTGTIDLSETREITFRGNINGLLNVFLFSGDVSADTTFTLEESGDDTNWDTSQEAGSDISDTLVQSEAMSKSFELIPGLYYKILFAGSTTGNVSYVITY